MGLTYCPETWVANYQSQLCKSRKSEDVIYDAAQAWNQAEFARVVWRAFETLSRWRRKKTCQLRGHFPCFKELGVTNRTTDDRGWSEVTQSSNAEFKNGWSNTSTHLIFPLWQGQGRVSFHQYHYKYVVCSPELCCTQPQTYMLS